MYLLVFQDKLDILVSEGDKVGTDKCSYSKQDAGLVKVHHVYSPEQP